ncbi:MAG: hypothetical protein JOZ38_08735 [Candidatus Eremiobacteraeota bacterium]|nr:hypothetical protein [Candidatus Eremiobacteraeota bacterium]
MIALTGALAFAAPAGNTVFGDVPVAPHAFPDYSPNQFALKGGLNVTPQAFKFGTHDGSDVVLAWYMQHLASFGWRIEERRANYPVNGADAVIATRKGEGLTVIVSPVQGGTSVSLIKLITSK